MDVNRRVLFAGFMTGLGAVAVVAGVALVSHPAALIVAGVLFMVFGLLPDWGA